QAPNGSHPSLTSKRLSRLITARLHRRDREETRMSEPAALYEKQDGVAVLTMNRPAVRNALNAEMLCRMADAWQDIQDDPAVRVAILTGAGEDAFCAGADLDRLVRMMQGLRPAETDFDKRII